MKNYLTKNNVRESLKEVIERNHIKVESFNDFVNEAYNYAVECKNNKHYDEHICVNMIKKYMDASPKALTEVWGIVSMYCFENLVHKCINTCITWDCDMEEVKGIGMMTIVKAARKYDWSKKFITYATTCVCNNLRRFNRESHPIHVPDKLAKDIAIIAEVLDEFEFDISTEEIKQILKERNAKIKYKKVEELETVCRIERSLNSPVDHGELKNMFDPEDNPAYIVMEQESVENIAKMFPAITAEIYGYDSAYITHMKTNGLSTYKMVVPFVKFKVVSQYLDDVAKENGEFLSLVDKIKLDICTYGLDGAIAQQSNYMASSYLSSAINKANAMTEEIERGERTVEECIGEKCDHSKLNYMLSKIFPVGKRIWSDTEKANSKLYRKALRKIGLDAVANEIESRI